MFNTELATYKTGGGALSDKSIHPGEYGRVSAWIKKIKNDLVLNKDIYGHPPSTVFDRPASQYMRVMTIDPGTGYAVAGDKQSYIVAADGTPQLRRHIDFSPPDTNGANTEQHAAETMLNLQPQTPGTSFITIVNPDFIPPATMRKLKIWVHHWILSRIPEQHLHLVNDVVKGDIKDLLVKVYGLAAREPKRYCKVIKTRMKNNKRG
jgi:hypothetical protein